jgi:hypothetical protein
MSTLKIVIALFVVGIAAIVINLITHQDPPKPPNEHVNETNFDRLRAGMKPDKVEAILGPPDQSAQGEIIQLERLGAADLQGTIEEVSQPASGGRLYIYCGRDDEVIEILFSEKDDTVIAAEYSVSDYPVIYRGPRVAKRSQDLAAVSARRSVGTDELQKQKETLTRYNRRKQLEKRSRGSFYSKETPDSVADESKAPTSELPAAEPSKTASPPKTVANQVQPPSLVTSHAPSQQRQPSEIHPTPEAKQIPAPSAPLVRKPTGPIELKLTSGRTLSDSSPKFELPNPWPDKIFPSSLAVYVAHNPDQSIRGVLANKKPSFHGPAVTLYDNGHIETVAFYAEGRLNGPVRMWTDQKEKQLYSEYKSGNKNGLTCLYIEKLPRLIQEWDAASMQQEYFVRLIDGQAILTQPSALSGDDAEEYAKAKDQLSAIEQRMHDNEIAFKRNLVDWYRKEIKKTKPPVAKSSKKPASPANARPPMTSMFLPQPTDPQWRNALIQANR